MIKKILACMLAIGCGGEAYEYESGELEQEIVTRVGYGWFDSPVGPLPCPTEMVSGTCFYPDPARARQVSVHLNLNTFGTPGTLERELVQWARDEAVARFNGFFTGPTGWAATSSQTALPDITISNDGIDDPDGDPLQYANGSYAAVEDFADTRCATTGITLIEVPSIQGTHKVCKTVGLKLRPGPIWMAAVEGGVPGQQSPEKKRDIYEWLVFQGLLRAAGVGVGLNDGGTVYNTDKLMPLNKSGLGVGPGCWLDSVGFINPTQINRNTNTCT
jgi:hypothetical protein